MIDRCFAVCAHEYLHVSAWCKPYSRKYWREFCLAIFYFGDFIQVFIRSHQVLILTV